VGRLNGVHVQSSTINENRSAARELPRNNLVHRSKRGLNRSPRENRLEWSSHTRDLIGSGYHGRPSLHHVVLTCRFEKLLLRLMSAPWLFSAAVECSLCSGRGEVVWRTVGNRSACRRRVGLMLVRSLLIDKEKSRPAGMLGEAYVVRSSEPVAAVEFQVQFPTGRLGPSHGTLLLVLSDAPRRCFS